MSRDFRPRAAGNNSQDHRSEGQFTLDHDSHHVAGGVSKGIKDNQQRLVLDLVDHRTDDGHPDGDFKNRQGKGDSSSPLNRDDGADGADGHVTDSGQKDDNSRQKNMRLEHDWQ